jgi:hypothetical protein
MDGAPIPTIEMAQNKAYTALFGVSTQEFFNFIQGDPSLLAGIPTLARINGKPSTPRRHPMRCLWTFAVLRRYPDKGCHLYQLASSHPQGTGRTLNLSVLISGARSGMTLTFKG